MRILNLIVEELAEVLHVDAAFAGIHDGGETADHEIRITDALNRLLNVGKLADTGGLNDDAVRLKLLLYLHKGFAEVTYKRAADASGIHLGDFHAGFLQESAVNADLAELVLNQNDLLALVTVCQEFLDERRLAGAEKSGENVNLNHVFVLSQADISR